MNDEYIPTLTHATERDIDLLLVEELFASFDFVTWMATQAGVTTPISTWDVKHSKRRTRSRREIDIFVEIEIVNGDSVAILIENKLDTTEQPDQAESYREELNVLAERYGRQAMIIVCPMEYAGRYPDFSGKFDAVVSYEMLSEYFRESTGEAGADTVLRLGFRADVIDQAIHKHRRGYTPIPDKVVGDFNALYVALLAEVAPEIRPGSSMLKPANPRESTSMIFDQDASLSRLPRDIRPRRFAHELGRGSERRANYVAVTFAGWGAFLPAIRARLEADAVQLGAQFSAKPPTKTRPNPGLVMSLPTDPVDNQGSFEEQRDSLVAGIRRAQELRRWLLGEQDLLHRWAELIENQRRSA
jgi:hypothetical protein